MLEIDVSLVRKIVKARLLVPICTDCSPMLLPPLITCTHHESHTLVAGVTSVRIVAIIVRASGG